MPFPLLRCSVKLPKIVFFHFSKFQILLYFNSNILKHIFNSSCQKVPELIYNLIVKYKEIISLKSILSNFTNKVQFWLKVWFCAFKWSKSLIFYFNMTFAFEFHQQNKFDLQLEITRKGTHIVKTVHWWHVICIANNEIKKIKK